ncbi:S1 family peptidase [Cryobacterium sp. 1639]|uniref:S1 family peptidase n=1 Tax=Cryobacterium inferilacus TaxID=2866629 RepID=UPI001C73DEBC|nr:S1 family peptidase [Cryobacterium sp. 1639]MBX0300626.1 S1 family peptidase [Cryobacterium sp. 1639]
MSFLTAPSRFTGKRFALQSAIVGITCVALVGGITQTAYAALPTGPSTTGLAGARPNATALPFRSSEQDWQTRANQAVDVLRERFPDAFAEAILGEASFTVRFRGDVPPEATAFLDGVGVPFELVGGVGFSEAELIGAVNDVHIAVLELVGPGVDFSTEPVSGTSEIKVIVDPATQSAARGENAQLDASAIELALETADSAYPKTFDVSVSLEEGAAVSTEGYGQAGGTKISGATGYCTSAFVVKRVGGSELGVVTAGHCPNYLQQISPNGNFSFDFRSEHQGASGDIQWMRSPVMMDSWFHYDYGLGYPVRAVATASVGTAICHFGVSTGRSCGWVKANYISITSDGKNYSNMSRAEGAELTSADGDSGGPWYQGTTAYGIHHGSAVNANPRYFTPVRQAEALFAVSVCIEGRCG